MTREAIFIHMSLTLQSMPISITVEEIDALVDRVITLQPENPKCLAYTIARNEGINRMRQRETVARRAAFLQTVRKRQREEEKLLREWERERDAVLQVIAHLKRTLPPQRYYKEYQRYLDVLTRTLRGESTDYPVSRDALYQCRRRGIVWLCKQSDVARRFYERYYAKGRRFGQPPLRRQSRVQLFSESRVEVVR